MLALIFKWTQQRNLSELRQLWEQAVKDETPSVASTEVLSCLEKKYRAMSK